MKLEAEARVERLRDVARTALGFSLGAFFVSVVSIGASIGDPAFVEGIASLSSLAIALSGFAYISLGLIAARLSPSSSLVRPAPLRRSK